VDKPPRVIDAVPAAARALAPAFGPGGARGSVPHAGDGGASGEAPEGPATGEGGAPVVLDEEPRQQPPGSFLASLPQFFVYPAILVATLAAVYLLLRVIGSGGPEDVRELLAELENSGPHGRWQVLHTLATGLESGEYQLADVSSDELAALYERLLASAESPVERGRLQQYLLLVVAHKRDARFTPLALEALSDGDADLRQMALQALALIGDPAALPELARRLEGNDVDERVQALGAVANIPGPEARELLAGSLRASDSIVARNAALLLAGEPSRDPRALPFLLHMLERSGYDSDPALDGPLRDLMDEASRQAVRADAVESFLIQACASAAALGDPAAIPSLQHLREADPSLKVRSAAIDALHALGTS